MTRLRKISIGAGALFLLSVIGGWIFLLPVIEIGTGFAAKQVCSCMYLGERSFSDCRADLRRYGPRMDVDNLPELSGVQAEIFPVARARAYYHKGAGCTQE